MTAREVREIIDATRALIAARVAHDAAVSAEADARRAVEEASARWKALIGAGAAELPEASQ